MNHYRIIPLLGFLITLILITLIINKRRNKALTIGYILFCSSLSLWYLLDIITWTPEIDPLIILTLMKIHTGCWIALGYFFALIAFALIEKPLNLFMKIYILPLLILVAITHSSDLILKGYQSHYWGTSDTPGPLYFYAIAFAYIPAIYSIFLLIDKYRKTVKKLLKKQLILILAGLITTLITAFLLGVIITPILNIYTYPDLGPTTMIIFTITTFVAIYKYNFLNPGIKTSAADIMAQINDIVMLFDTNNILVDANKRAREIFTISRDSYNKVSANDIFQNKYTYTNDFSSEKITLHLNNKDRHFIISQSSLFEKHIEQGKIVILTDITSQKKIDDLLNISEERFKAIVENSPDMIWAMDMNLNNTYCSPSVLQFRGYTPEEILSQSIEDTFPLDSLDVVVREFAQALDEAQKFPSSKAISKKLELKIKHKNGNLIPIELTATLIRDSEGNLKGVHGITRDITTQKQYEAQLKEAQKIAEKSDKLKSEFLANMSHEIRTPLNSIMGYTDLILMDELSEEHREHLKTIKNSSNHLLELINDILDLSKIEAGVLELETASLSLKAFFNELKKNYTMEIKKQKKDIELSIELSNKVDYILTDPLHLKQILMNLLNNSVKFTQKGYISLKVKKIGTGFLLFTVSDSGIGIEDNLKDSLFKPFQQGEAALKTQSGGAGLGLAISYKLAQLMNGSLSFTSSKEAQERTIFYLKIPYFPVRKHSSDKKIISPGNEKNTHTILVADDNKENLSLFTKLLHRYGYTVLTAQNGKEAVDIYRQNKEIACILMDIQMPLMDGISAAKRILALEKSHSPKNPVPIIALTAAVMNEDILKYQQSGFSSYISKPVEINTFYREINHALNIYNQ